MVRVTCFFSLQVRLARAPIMATRASKIDGWSPCARIIFSTSDCESGKETLCIHSFQISSRSIHCQCNSMRSVPFILGPNIGRARNWPSTPPAALYECYFEQWARIFGRVMTRPTRLVPPGLHSFY